MNPNAIGIVTFAFGVPANIPVNTRLAFIAKNISLTAKYPNPIYTQPDIDIGEGFDVTYITEEPNSPSPTLRIAREAAAWAEKCDMRYIWVVCAKPHLWRCKRDLRRALDEAGLQTELWVPSEIEESDYMEWFDPKSTQPRTQSFKHWWVRDLILRLMPFSLYKRVAG